MKFYIFSCRTTFIHSPCVCYVFEGLGACLVGGPELLIKVGSNEPKLDSAMAVLSKPRPHGGQTDLWLRFVSSPIVQTKTENNPPQVLIIYNVSKYMNLCPAVSPYAAYP